MQQIQTKGTKGFLQWMRIALPQTYRSVKKDLQQSASMSGLGLIEPVQTASEQPMSSSLATTLREIAQVAAQAYLTKEQIDAQQRIVNVQLTRAQNNLPPLNIDPQTYGLPAPSIGFGLTGDTRQLLMWGGGIALGVYLLASMMKGRRRA